MTPVNVTSYSQNVGHVTYDELYATFEVTFVKTINVIFIIYFYRFPNILGNADKQREGCPTTGGVIIEPSSSSILSSDS